MANRSFQSLRSVLRLALILGACASGTMAHAANNCPWLNEATASGMLGGQAVGDFQAASPGQPAVCTFTQHQDTATRVLKIQVEIVPDATARLRSMESACGTDRTPLQAIGNEAVACVADDRGRPGEQALGRVRDQVFTIRISSSLKSDPILTRNELQRLIYTAAEQVAGNLF